MARVSERGPSTLSSLASSLHAYSQVKGLGANEKVGLDDAPVCCLNSLVRQLLGILLLLLPLPNE